MGRRFELAAGLVCAVLLWAAAGVRDLFTRRQDGRQLTGTLIGRTEDLLMVKTDTGATLRLPASEWQVTLSSRPATSRPAATRPVQTGARRAVPPASSDPKSSTLGKLALERSDIASSVLGIRVSGEVLVGSILPDPDAAGFYSIRCIDASHRSGGVYMRWIGNKWWRVICVLRAPESTALRLRKGDTLNIAGDVVRAEIGPGAGDIDKVLTLWLRNAQAG